MSEKSKFVAYKKKLQGICDENNFVFRFRQDRYPITLTIKPATGVDEQMSLLEKAEDTNVTSPDASLVFMVLDGDLKYKISDTFNISETLFNKLKNLFKYNFPNLSDYRLFAMDCPFLVMDLCNAINSCWAGWCFLAFVPFSSAPILEQV